MDKIVIEGGRSLKGVVKISGSKNSALPLIAATLLTKEKVVLSNVPNLRDVRTMLRLLSEMGTSVSHPFRKYHIQAQKLKKTEAPYDLVRTMRASILVLGPLLARAGKARVSLPGGCAIGARPINLHLKALEKMGAKIKLEEGYVQASCSRLKGATIVFDTVTVTGTENIMMAATLAKGKTILKNAAREPEIIDLAHMLKAMGAKITGEGTNVIEIEGVDSLQGCRHKVIPRSYRSGHIFNCCHYDAR